MTQEGLSADIGAIQQAHDEALQENATRAGLGSVAHIEVPAHGRQLSVAEALVNCKPFANMVESLSKNLANLPEAVKTDILTNSIKDMATTTPEIPAPAAADVLRAGTADAESKTPKKKLI